jgi:hypothetical protein
MRDKEVLYNLKEYLQSKIDRGETKIFYNELDHDEKIVDCINAITNLQERLDKAQSIIRYYFTDGFEDVYDMLNNISDALNEENKKTWKEIVGIENE